MTLSSLLVLLTLSSGSPVNDLVSFLDVERYFKAHAVVIKVETMVELAGRDPVDAKTQVAQLLAIRWLGANAEQARKNDKARAVLVQVAQGKQAQDPHGFARDYARRAVSRLDGKPIPAGPAIPANSLRGEAIQWFPVDMSLVGGIDLRASGKIKAPEEDFARLVAGLMPPQVQEEMAKVADQVGNLRLDRVAIGLRLNAEPAKNPERVYVRFTGAGDLKRCSAFLAMQMPGGKLSEVKGARGETITLLGIEQGTVSLAFFGDRDVLLAVSPEMTVKSMKLLEESLAVRAGTKPGAASGPIKAVLRDVPSQAFALLAGELTEEHRKQLNGEKSFFRVLPQHFAAHLSRDKALQLRFRAVMTVSSL